MAEMNERAELRKDIKVLERRRDFLGRRIANISQDAGNYDRAEFRALQRALGLLEKELECHPPKNGSARTSP